MPREPTSTDPTPAASTAIDHAAGGHAADDAAAGSTDAAAGSDGEQEADNPEGDRVAALERRMTELEAELDAIRGLLDGIEAVDETVERRASTALAKAEALEEQFASEETGLVRERLPEGNDDGRPDGSDAGRTGRYRDTDGDSGPDADGNTRQAGPQSRRESGRDTDGFTDAADNPGGDGRVSTRTDTRGRGRPADADATDGDAAGTGAISSVGPGGTSATGSADESNQSLAARLRNAFR